MENADLPTPTHIKRNNAHTIIMWKIRFRSIYKTTIIQLFCIMLQYLDLFENLMVMCDTLRAMSMSHQSTIRPALLSNFICVSSGWFSRYSWMVFRNLVRTRVRFNMCLVNILNRNSPFPVIVVLIVDNRRVAGINILFKSECKNCRKIMMEKRVKNKRTL